MRYAKELELARATALEAGKIQLEGRPAARDIATKADLSPVTLTDRRCEALIRGALLLDFPRDSFLGEEDGAIPGESGRTWIVDPLDGTRPFLRGIPTHSALIALEEDGEPVVGVIHLPALGETYWAAKGSGAFLNGKPIRVSATADLSRAMGSALGYVEKCDLPVARRLLDLMRQWDYGYGFMDNYTYGSIAAGRIDVCVNLLDKAWDCAAAACIVAEAGGAWSDMHGVRSVHNGSIVLSNGVLHDEVIAQLNASEV
jgi:histidinol-phosphatase